MTERFTGLGILDAELHARQYAGLGPWMFRLRTRQGAAQSVQGDYLAMTFSPPEDSQTASFSLSTGDGEITIGGDDYNVVTVDADDTHSQVAGTWAWVLRNSTDDEVLARGMLTIEACVETST